MTEDGSRSLSLGFKDLPSGSAEEFLEATKNIFYDIAQFILPKTTSENEINTTQGKLLQSFKNVQSDRHIVNKSYFDQIADYHTKFLPHCIDNFHQPDCSRNS